MIPALLPPMLWGEQYDVFAYRPARFPASKTVAKVGPAGVAMIGRGPASKTVAKVGPASALVSMPTGGE